MSKPLPVHKRQPRKATKTRQRRVLRYPVPVERLGNLSGPDALHGPAEG